MGKLSKHTRKRLFKLLVAIGMFGLMAVWDRVIPQNTAWKLAVSMLLGGAGLFILPYFPINRSVLAVSFKSGISPVPFPVRLRFSSGLPISFLLFLQSASFGSATFLQSLKLSLSFQFLFLNMRRFLWTNYLLSSAGFSEHIFI